MWPGGDSPKGPRGPGASPFCARLAGPVAVPANVTCMLTADHGLSAPVSVPRAHPLLHHPQAAPTTIAKHHECSWDLGVGWGHGGTEAHCAPGTSALEAEDKPRALSGALALEAEQGREMAEFMGKCRSIGR